MSSSISFPYSDLRPDWRVAVPGLLLLAGGALYIAGATGGKLAWLFLLGGALRLVLYHPAFGFASDWPAFHAAGRGGGPGGCWRWR